MRLVCYILLFFPTFILSAELGISIGGKNELVLTADNCEDLLKQQTAICEWKKETTPAFSIPNPKKCEKLKNNKYKITLFECLPDLAKDYQQKKLVHDGPNCWGTAMSFKDLSPTPRFIWPEEMQYWMDSPLCRKLDVNEARMPGDLINVYAPENLSAEERNQKDVGIKFLEILYPNKLTKAPDIGIGYTGYQRLLHSVTYVSDKLAFGKDSPSQLDRFYFHPMEEVYGRPRSSEDKDCQEDQSRTPYLRENQKPPKKFHREKCGYFSLAYRCENFKDYFSKQNLSKDNLDTWKNIESLQGLQKKLFPLVTSSNKVLEKCEITLLTTLADITLKRASEELKLAQTDLMRQRLLTLEYFAAAGIRQTLEQAQLIKTR
jgi:hypothetical protein